MTERVICWFSCGVTSAVATLLTLVKYPDAIPVYCDTGSEHPDNQRLLKDCEKLFNKEVLVIRSDKYKSTWEVFESGYLIGAKGAKCTTELKKLVRRKFQQPDDLQVFGFDINEQSRAKRFIDNNFEVKVYFPLIEQKLSKRDCINIFRQYNIALPAMYELGYKNNNCIGCVKGGAGYWNKIRQDFPEVFDRMAKLERKLGATILRDRTNGQTETRLYLDELKPNAGRYESLDIDCGLFCGEV